jgi:hypothetical protein
MRLSDARAMIGQVDDEAPASGTLTDGPEQQLLLALSELAEAAVGAASAYLYSGDPASLDPDVACYAQKVAVKAAGELARMQLWLRAPLSSGPDGD